MRRALAGLAAAALAACAAASGASGGPPGSIEGASRAPVKPADEWITLADFRYVTSVSAGASEVVLGTTAGVERFDTLRDAWLPPVTAADGLPDDRVTAVLADPTGGDAWIGTARGLARLIGFTGEVVSVWGPPAASVDALLAEPAQGAVWARVGGLWWTGPLSGETLERASSPPEGALDGPIPARDVDPFDVPWLDPFGVRSETAPDRLFRLTLVDRDPRGEWFAGTWGDNGRRWGAGGAEWEPLAFGLAGPPGGPVARASDGYWFLPDPDRGAESPAARLLAAPAALRAEITAGAPAPAAAAHASTDLATWTYAVPGLAPDLIAAAARAAVATGDTIWLATDAGLVRGVEGEWRSWDARLGAGLGALGALAVDGGRLWLGGSDGLVAWDRAAGAETGRWLGGRRVTAIAVADDALFVGTDVGLYAAPRAAGALPDSVARLRTRGTDVRAAILRGALLVVATEAGVEAFDRRTGEWTVTGAADGRLGGAPLALAADAEQVWVGTTTGLARWRPETGEWRVYGPRDGLAGVPVLHVLADGDRVWASTPRGVSRFAWTARW